MNALAQRLAVLLAAADAGNGGGGGSVITQAAAAGDDKGGGAKDGVQTSGKDGAAGEGGAAGETPEQKAAAAAKAALEAPVDEKWSPKLGDGQRLDDAELAEFRKLAKEGGFKAGQAQKLVEFDLARQAAREKASEQAFTQQRQSWRDSLKKELGAKYEQTLVDVKKAMTRFGGTDAFKKFADAGAGDHPEFVKFVAAVGASLGEDPGVRSGAKPANGASPEDAELRQMFPNSPALFS